MVTRHLFLAQVRGSTGHRGQRTDVTGRTCQTHPGGLQGQTLSSVNESACLGVGVGGALDMEQDEANRLTGDRLAASGQDQDFRLSCCEWPLPRKFVSRPQRGGEMGCLC